jgi:hypothetical protein
MRHLRAGLLALTMAAACLGAALICRPGFGQGQAYKSVPVTLPTLLRDASFDAFRQQLARIVQKKDRAELARVVAASFFWIPEESDIADKSVPPVDNLVKALGLDDAIGWESLAAYAEERTASADAVFDQNAADGLFDETHTEAGDWGFPLREGIEIRADAKPNAAVIDRLGAHLVRILSEGSAAKNEIFVKVLTPLGNVGFAPADSVLPMPGEQLCYMKETDGWKIAGFFGGETN